MRFLASRAGGAQDPAFAISHFGSKMKELTTNANELDNNACWNRSYRSWDRGFCLSRNPVQKRREGYRCCIAPDQRQQQEDHPDVAAIDRVSICRGRGADRRRICEVLSGASSLFYLNVYYARATRRISMRMQNILSRMAVTVAISTLSLAGMSMPTPAQQQPQEEQREQKRVQQEKQQKQQTQQQERVQRHSEQDQKQLRQHVQQQQQKLIRQQQQRVAQYPSASGTAGASRT